MVESFKRCFSDFNGPLGKRIFDFKLPLGALQFYETIGITQKQFKLRVISTCLSFLILVEILNAREERAKLQRKQSAEDETKKKKDPANTWFTWEEIVEHD